MAEIDKIASSAGISWRALLRLTPSLAPSVADALCTRKRFRTDGQQGMIAAAQQITEGDPEREQREKTLRRMQGVNDLATGRVHGRTLEAGQPRGQVRRKTKGRGRLS